MFRPNVFLRCALLLVAFILFAGNSSAADPVLLAGAAIADITPQQWPIPMVGSFSGREATHAWDPLNARALVLDNGDTQIAFVVVDSCYCPRSLFDEAKRRLHENIGIKTDHLLMAATHTHTAPPAKDRRGVEADKDYVEHMIRGIVSAVTQAFHNRAPAEIGFGEALLPEEVFNRRWFMKPGSIPPNPFGETTDQVRFNPPRGSDLLDRPAGPTDPEICFLAVRTAEGRPICLLANYSLHYVGGIPAGGVSSDYFGDFAEQIKHRLTSDGRDTLPPFVGILSNGTSGNINNINFREPRPRSKPFERSRVVAGRVVDCVVAALDDLEYSKWVPLAMVESKLSLKTRKPTDFQLAQAKKFVDETDPKKLPHPWSKQYARWALDLRDGPETEEVVLQAIRIGDVGITAIPCEVFVEIGLELKRENPFASSFTIELANGHYGYLPTPAHHRLGGYETWLGSGTLETTASEKIYRELLSMLRKLAEQ